MQAQSIVTDAVLNSRTILNQNIDYTEKSAKIIHEEKGARSNLDALRTKIKISRPKGIGFSIQVNNEWNDYQSQYSQSIELLKKAEAELESQITSLAIDSSINLNAISRLDDVIESRTESFMKNFRSVDNDNKKSLATINTNAREELSILR